MKRARTCLCEALCNLCVSVVKRTCFTTETQRTHRVSQSKLPIELRARFKLKIIFITITLLLSLTADNCGGAKPHANERRFDLKGKIVSFNKAQQQIIIAHEVVPGLMEAMTMPFTLKDADAYDVMQAGDEIQATLVVEDGSSRFWLENPVITQVIAGDKTPANEITSTESQPGAQVPDFSLLNQDSEPVSLKNYRGQFLLVTFIYTRCPLPDYCTLMSNNFAEINRTVEKNTALRGKVQLLSVSVDPERDTPQVLRSYGAAHTEKYADEKFATWEFLTGQPDEVKKLATFFGLSYTPDGDQIIHSLRTALISPEGKLLKMYRGNEWKPSAVIADVQSELDQRPA